MPILDYLFISLAAVGMAGLGGLFTNGDFVRKLIFGLLISALVVSLLAWTAPLAIRWTLMGLAAAGLVLFVVRWFSTLMLSSEQFGHWLSRENVWRLAGGLACVGFFAFLLRDLHHNNWFYADSELVYFAHVVEMFLADYGGPLRVPTYYPAESAASPLVAPSFFGALLAFVPNVTLVHVTEVRYLLLTGVIARAVWLLLARTTDRRYFLTIPMLLCLGLLFGRELGQIVTTSVAPYFIIFTEIIILAFFEKRAEKALLILTASLLIIDPVTIFSTAILLLVYLLAFSEQRWHPVVILFGCLTVANILVVGWLPKPFDNFSYLDLAFTFANPFTPKPSMDYRTIVGFDQIVRSFPWIQNSILGVAAGFLLGFVKYFGLALVAVGAARKSLSSSATPYAIRGLEIFIVAALFNWILIRNGQHGTAHQLHGILNIVPLLIMSVFIASTVYTARAWRGVVFGWTFVLLFAMFVIPGGSNLSSKLPLTTRDETPSAISHRTAHEMSDVDAATWRENQEPAGAVAIRMMLRGQRLNRDSATPANSGYLRHWIRKDD